MKPNKKKLSLDPYAGTDFAGIFTAEDNDDHICVKVEQESYLRLEKYPYTGAQNCSQRSHSVHLKLNI